jgi:hypothetical protein
MIIFELTEILVSYEWKMNTVYYSLHLVSIIN